MDKQKLLQSLKDWLATLVEGAGDLIDKVIDCMTD